MDEKIIKILMDGRSILLELIESDGLTIHISEGIVCDSDIAWNAPSPAGIVIASSGELKVPKESKLKHGQVSLAC